MVADRRHRQAMSRIVDGVFVEIVKRLLAMGNLRPTQHMLGRSAMIEVLLDAFPPFTRYFGKEIGVNAVLALGDH